MATSLTNLTASDDAYTCPGCDEVFTPASDAEAGADGLCYLCRAGRAAYAAETAPSVDAVPAVRAVETREPVTRPETRQKADAGGATTKAGVLLFVAETLDAYRAHPDFDGLDDYRFRLRAIDWITDDLGYQWSQYATELVDEVLKASSPAALTARDGTSRAHWQLITEVTETMARLDLDPLTRLVGYAMVRHANGRTRLARPGIVSLLRMTGLAPNSLYKHMALLKKAGVIDVAKENARGRAKQWRFLISKVRKP